MSIGDLEIPTLREKIARDRMNLLSDLVNISQVPAPTFDESDRAEVLADAFKRLHVDTVYIDPVGNVIAHRKTRNTPPVCVTAHLDTVFDRSVNHTVQIDDRVVSGPGVGDNSLGLATLLSIVRLLPEDEPGNLILLATTGTEGRGNLQGTRYFVKNFEQQVGFTLCLEGHGLGRIDHWSLGTIRIQIKTESQGGHVWRDKTGENPIRVISQLVTDIYRIYDEYPSEKPFVFVNAGRIRGGSSFNTVPYNCELDLEIRADETEVMEELNERIIELIQQYKERSSVELNYQEITRRPVSGLPENHWLVEEIESIHSQLKVDSVKGPGSSDSCIFIDAGIPTVTVGLARGHHRHHENERLDLSSLETGQLQVISALISCNQRLRNMHS